MSSRLSTSNNRLCYIFQGLTHKSFAMVINLLDTLINRNVKGIQVIIPVIHALLVEQAFRVGSIATPDWPQGPSTNLLLLTFRRALSDGSVQCLWEDSMFHPIDHDSQIRLRERTIWFSRVGRAVRRTRNQEQAKEFILGGRRLVIAHPWIHNLSNGLPVSD